MTKVTGGMRSAPAKSGMWIEHTPDWDFGPTRSGRESRAWNHAEAGAIPCGEKGRRGVPMGSGVAVGSYKEGTKKGL